MFCTILIISIILIMGYYLYKKCSIKEGFTFN